MKITAIIIINGSPEYVKDSLSSLVDYVDEIIIGDVGMTYKIPAEIEKKVNIKTVKLSSSIPFADLVKEDLKKEASGEYILYIDPDEIIQEELWKILKEKMEEFDYFFNTKEKYYFWKMGPNCQMVA